MINNEKSGSCCSLSCSEKAARYGFLIMGTALAFTNTNYTVLDKYHLDLGMKTGEGISMGWNPLFFTMTALISRELTPFVVSGVTSLANKTGVTSLASKICCKRGVFSQASSNTEEDLENGLLNDAARQGDLTGDGQNGLGNDTI